MVWKLPGYQPVDDLGSGSTGTVVTVRDEATETLVAVKYLTDSVYDAPGFAEGFRALTTKLAGVDNPHLALVFEFVESADAAAVISELVHGVSLRQLLESGPLEPEAALFLVKGVLTGVAELHNVDIVHRDIRPENLLVTADGTVKIVDIGIAPPVDRRSEASRYLAPEVWAGERPSFASDVYAAAATLFECLTGDESATLQSAELPPRVRKIVTRNLSVKPDDRVGDGGKMLDALALVALSSYGSNWESTGKEKLLDRLDQAKSKPRPAAPRSRKIIPTERTTHVLIAVGLTILLALIFVAATTGVFVPGTRAAADTDDSVIQLVQHIPDVQSGPPVPPPAVGPTADKVKPSQPTGVNVSGRSITAITIDWNPSHDNVKVTGYIVQRGGHKIATTYTPGYTDSGLAAQTTYGYSVIAFDAAGNQSPVSTNAFGTTLMKPDTTAPSTPSHLRSTSNGLTKIGLVWSGSHDNIGVAGYDVFRDGKRIASVDHTSFVDAGLTPASKHSYYVRAFDTSNNSSRGSNVISASTTTASDSTPPSTPSITSASGISPSQIQIAWTASHDTNGVAGYEVFRNGVGQGSVTGTSFTDNGLAASTTYSYTVQAFDASGNNSPSSGSRSATTRPAPVIPPTPTPTLTPTPTATPTPTPTATPTVAPTTQPPPTGEPTQPTQPSNPPVTTDPPQGPPTTAPSPDPPTDSAPSAPDPVAATTDPPSAAADASAAPDPSVVPEVGVAPSG